ncbi:LCP family protein [Actinocrispum wychmicini]|uniref:LytR family transcriptional attenuator n=1 Tax=Actinocrispum wychmicini TaxID=1213861 RepID=A0A4R2JQK6_9PSEU|nr:LCP family protein [Actinocrispum wychmicini]TCO62511.1 LytR family transcriptional attenuator [Actinocrispum wychmicini]
MAGKVALAILSVAVLSATGIGYDKYNQIASGYQTADVLDPGSGGPKPADGATDILLVGLDSRVDAQGHPLSKELLNRLNAGKADGVINTDTLILLRVLNDGGKVVGVSIPRDSYVDIPGGYGKHKINSAYARAKNAAYAPLRKKGVTDAAQLEVQTSQEGAAELIKTIQQLTGATIDHYAEVNLLGFADITDAVGGADVCLLKPVNDDFSGAHFPAGPMTLAGPEALAFVRQRHGLPNGDLDRVVRQQVFLKGMAQKVLSAGTLTDSGKLGRLVDAIKKSLVIDPKWNIIDFAKQMQGMSGGNLDFRTIPTGNPALKTPDDGDAVEINPSQVKTFVQQTLPSASPPQTPGSSPPSGAGGSAGNPSNGSITVDVRNGNGGNGLAAQVAKTLTDHGFKQGTTVTGASRTKTVVLYPKGDKDNADKVVAALGSDYTAQQDASVKNGHIVVYLGKDFKSSQGLTGDGMLQLSPNLPALDQPPGSTTGSNGAPCIN